MTENEKLQKAIEEEKELYEIMKDRYEKLGLESCKDRAEEHELNIKWLEEIQQYRAIGTVEDLKTMKENGAFTGVELAQILAMQMELKKYQSIGTIEEFKALKEKNEPKKAIGKKKYDEAYCPACNEVISDGEFWALDEYVHHCNYCGQAVKGVDWSE